MMQTKRLGFTLIELMLAMAFIGMLMIATITTVIFVTKQYSRGVTYKLINQSGRDIGAAIKRDAASVAIVGTPLVKPAEAGAGNLGRLCLGAYTYVWGDSDKLKLQNNSGAKYTDTGKEIIMARVPDSGGHFCVKDGSGNYSTDIRKVDVSGNDSAVEMLPNDKGDYAIHDIELTSIPANLVGATSRLYRISYTIGTNQQGTINSSIRCEAPNKATNNYNFCAVNKFEVMVQAGL